MVNCRSSKCHNRFFVFAFCLAHDGMVCVFSFLLGRLISGSPFIRIRTDSTLWFNPSASVWHRTVSKHLRWCAGALALFHCTFACHLLSISMVHLVACYGCCCCCHFFFFFYPYYPKRFCFSIVCLVAPTDCWLLWIVFCLHIGFVLEKND